MILRSVQSLYQKKLLTDDTWSLQILFLQIFSMVPRFTGMISAPHALWGPVNYCHEPIYELSSDICSNVSYTNLGNSLKQN